MTYKETLEQEYQRHLKEPATQLGFEIYDEQSSNTGGALIRLRSAELKIQLVNDRGIINLDIGPVGKTENFTDAELLNSLIQLNTSAEPLTKLARKKLVNKRLGLSEQVSFLTTNYRELTELFSKRSNSRTFAQLEALGSERFNNMIG
tara:strand:+ start:73 stop:516 length:444 start_codon:yes stop_codon:yes gene_type:complete